MSHDYGSYKNIGSEIMQTECRTSSLLECYAELLLILYKDKHKKRKETSSTFLFMTAKQRFNNINHL